MAGIRNSGQYYYFNSIIQCLANNPTIQHLLDEHILSVEEDDSKYECCLDVNQT